MKTSNYRFSLAAVLVATGCGVEPDLGPDTPDPLIYEFARDQVEGSYDQDGVTVRFELARIADGVLHVVVTTPDGITIVDSTIARGRETTTLLGEYHISDVAPALSQDALAELAEVPEIQIVPELRKAIAAAGIDRALLGDATQNPDSILCPVIAISPKRPGAWAWADAIERL